MTEGENDGTLDLQNWEYLVGTRKLHRKDKDPKKEIAENLKV
jgi:hypothetical protein